MLIQLRFTINNLILWFLVLSSSLVELNRVHLLAAGPCFLNLRHFKRFNAFENLFDLKLFTRDRQTEINHVGFRNYNGIMNVSSLRWRLLTVAHSASGCAHQLENVEFCYISKILPCFANETFLLILFHCPISSFSDPLLCSCMAPVCHATATYHKWLVRIEVVRSDPLKQSFGTKTLRVTLSQSSCLSRM